MGIFRLEVDQKFEWVDFSKKIANEHTIRKEYFMGIKWRTNIIITTHNIESVDEERGKIGLLQNR